VIQKQRFSIVDTHVPVIATPLSDHMSPYLGPHRNQILLGGHHQEVRRLISPGLNPINLVRGIARRCPTKDVRRTLFVRTTFRFRRRLFATGKPLEWWSVEIGGTGWPRNVRGASAVLEGGETWGLRDSELIENFVSQSIEAVSHFLDLQLKGHR